MMNKVVVQFCIIVALCMVAACNGADDSKKPEFPPEVIQVCKNTAYPDLCSLMIVTDPTAKTTDLTKRIIIFIRTTMINAIGTIDLMKEMINNRNLKGDEEVMNCFKNCSRCYVDVVGTLDDSLVELVNKNYGAMKEKIQKADVYETTCQNCFAATTLKDDMSPHNEMLGKLGKITISFVDDLQKAG